jgi:hypothetical protein
MQPHSYFTHPPAPSLQGGGALNFLPAPRRAGVGGLL